MLRKRRDALEADRARVAELEAEIADAERDVARKPVLQARLEDLSRRQAEVGEMLAALTAAPAIEVRFALHLLGKGNV